MRIPLVGGDTRPIAWWEGLFAPVLWAIMLPLLFIAAPVSVLYCLVYPDHRAHLYDFGTLQQQEVMRRYRRFGSWVSFWRRCGRVIAFPFQRRRSWSNRRRS